MPRKITGRHLLWNVKSVPQSGDPPQQSWTFVIVNEPREIGLIEQRIREQLEPTENERTVTKGPISGPGGVHYKAITIDSYNGMRPDDVDLRAVYGGPRKRDERLGSHRTPDGLQRYIDEMFAGS
jgi:hypothetical protein